MIVIGLGSGRSGTASLAHLLNSQKNAMCFHELNPSCMRFRGTVQPALNTVREFSDILSGGDPSRVTADLSRRVTIEPYESLSKMEKVDLIGDIAMYYISYVSDILKENPETRFVCLKRDKDATVQSWIRKTTIRRWRSRKISSYLYSKMSGTPYYTEYNFWQEHDRPEIAKDPIWDKCFPKFLASSKKDAIAQYWDYYYSEASRLAKLYPDNFKIVDLEALNTNDGQLEVLSHCGIAADDQVYTDAHLHAIPG
jgi:hypothetical protein